MRALTAVGFMAAFAIVGVMAVNGMKTQSSTTPTSAPAQAIEKANSAGNLMESQATQLQQQANQQKD